ncbi:MAG: allophanate hydrolase [Bryobacterales bacterium]|nr:allophanate hydrolase [Bryobacterales bacterium]
MSSYLSFDIAHLRAYYQQGTLRPSELVREVYERIAQNGVTPVWIHLPDRKEAVRRALELEHDPASRALPLYGIPFAVKDNIDVAGAPTTAGCPKYAYQPQVSATVVRRLVEAGALFIGKTNLDQFATGLVGQRSPYGGCASVFNPRYISGGSSSGSAVAVARGEVSFSLGTDTAGSGRVPAAFNNLIGLKPTRGALSTAGVVPACRTLDCVTVFTHTAADADLVYQTAAGFDAADPYSRRPGPGDGAAPWLRGAFRFGVPKPSQWEFFGDDGARDLYAQSIERLKSLGGEMVEIDYAPFLAAAQLLYAGPWVAERLTAIQAFAEKYASEIHPVVRGIILGGASHSAVNAFDAQYKLAALRAATLDEWRKMDVMLLPTTGTIYTRAEVEADPVRLNSKLGHYTNFVNLLDLAAVALPAGFRQNGLPFGVTLIADAWTERALLALTDRMHRALGGRLGGTEAQVEETPALSVTPAATRCVEVAVVGAHLSGQPLNSQLTERGARLVRTTRTAPGYRLYALKETLPPNPGPAKPGLVRDATFTGPGIELEVWAVPEDAFGSFVALVPAPLGIGSATIEDGSSVKCFICEQYAIAGSLEITQHGGWRGWLRSRAQPAA